MRIGDELHMSQEKMYWLAWEATHLSYNVSAVMLAQEATRMSYNVSAMMLFLGSLTHEL